MRAMELSDAKKILERWNTLELRRTLATMIPVSISDEEEWIKNNWKLMREGTEFNFLITDKSNKFLGTSGFYGISKINRRAKLGIAIHDPDLRGKGYGTDAVITCCAIGFNILNFHTIHLTYVDYNKGSKAYYNAGFTEVGRHRDAIFRFGKYADLVQMDILEDEFRSKFPDYTLFE